MRLELHDHIVTLESASSSAILFASPVPADMTPDNGFKKKKESDELHLMFR